MTHYVCTGGCGMVANEAGFCQDESCAMYGAPLTACECEDGEHEMAMAAVNGEGEDDELEDDEEEMVDVDLDSLDDWDAEDADEVRA